MSKDPEAPPMRYYDAHDPFGVKQIQEVWSSRELLLQFFRRDLLIRYRQVFIGVLWVLLQPVLGTLIFICLFFILGTNPSSGNVSYPVTILIGMLCWQFLASSFRDATGSLVNYRHVVTKIYFPRLLLPLSGVLCALFDFLVGALLLIPTIIWTQTEVQWSTLWICVPVALWMLLFCVGCIAWLSSLNAMYRDVGYALPFVLQLGMFVSPIVYDLEKVTSRLGPIGETFYEANPIASCVSLMRWSIVGSQPPSLAGTLAAIVVTMIVLFSGLAWFRSTDQQLADRI